jgi:hypothetical protein
MTQRINSTGSLGCHSPHQPTRATASSTITFRALPPPGAGAEMEFWRFILRRCPLQALWCHTAQAELPPDAACSAAVFL